VAVHAQERRTVRPGQGTDLLGQRLGARAPGLRIEADAGGQRAAGLLFGGGAVLGGPALERFITPSSRLRMTI